MSAAKQTAISGAGEASGRSRTAEVWWLFLKLGTIAFGGPAAHTALMREEIVRRRGWLDDARFLDLMGATNLIPGPNSTELALHIGHRRAGWKGLVLAGTAFILPAMLIVLAIAWAYGRYGSRPEAAWLLYGIKPVIIAVVVHALWSLARVAVKRPLTAAVGLGVLALIILGANEIVLLLVAGTVMMLTVAVQRWRGVPTVSGAVPLLAPWLRPSPAHILADSAAPLPAVATTLDATPGLPVGQAVLARVMLEAPAPVDGLARAAVSAGGRAAGIGGGIIATVAVAGGSVSLLTLFLVFLKIGSVLFGSGYVLLAFLRADVVGRYGWLTEEQLLDAVAVGQFTPGPLFTTATFIGYQIAGLPGALVATVGIFLPAFVFVAITAPFIPLLRRSPWLGAFLDGVNVASLALMAAVTWLLGRAAVIDPLTLALALVALALLVRWRVNSAWLVLGGATMGLVAKGLA